MTIEVRQPRTQEELDLYYDLRWRVLREQWTKSRESGRDEHEENAFHLTAWDGPKLLGTGRLHFNSPDEAQIRCMAVEEAYDSGPRTTRPGAGGKIRRVERQGGGGVFLPQAWLSTDGPVEHAFQSDLSLADAQESLTGYRFSP
jgi:hypothetical protein